MSYLDNVKVVCPPMWAGQEKVKGIFSCGACPHPEVCADADQCERVSPKEPTDG